MVRGRLPRGAFLLEVALEELAKALLCERYESRSHDLRDLWAAYRSHQAKVREVMYLFPGVSEAELTKTLLEWRERALYADVGHDGRAWTPDGLVAHGGMTAEMLVGYIEAIDQEIRRQVAESVERRRTNAGPTG